MVVVISTARSSFCPPLPPWPSTWLMCRTRHHLLLGHLILAMFMKSQCQWVWWWRSALNEQTNDQAVIVYSSTPWSVSVSSYINVMWILYWEVSQQDPLSHHIADKNQLLLISILINSRNKNHQMSPKPRHLNLNSLLFHRWHLPVTPSSKFLLIADEGYVICSDTECHCSCMSR